MKSIIKCLALSFVLLQGSFILSGQDLVTIKGKVVTFDEIPINKAEVTAKKSGQKVFTDSLGRFTIDCDKKDKIFVNAEGFDRVSVKVKKYEGENINLVYSNEENSFKKATENGHVSEELLQNAIETNPLKGEKDYSRYTSIYDIIDDEIYTVRVNGTSITTTKPTSFTSSQEVLLVVDGTIVSDISFITPMNVKSIKHLEGPEAAKYGSRGGNGVIEITLKDR